MAADTQHTHRPGAFKQSNKSHKHGRHRSKGELMKETKGKVDAKTLSKKAKKVEKRIDRRNKALQSRKKKRDEVLAFKRSKGGSTTPPLLVAVVPLCAGLETEPTLELLKTCISDATVNSNEQGVTHISVPRFKQRFSFITPEFGNLYAILDAAKVADILMFVLSPELGIDDWGEYCLSSLFAQGLPACLHIVQGMKNIPPKKQPETKKMLQKHLEKRFPKDKFHGLDSTQDAVLILHQLGSQKLRRISLRENRPHIMAENISFELEDQQSETGTLKVSGYLRGRPLSANGLVHIPGWGDFQMSQIDAPSDPYPIIVKTDKKNRTGDSEMEEDVKVLEKANPGRQESLQSENIPDPMEGEQTWPTEEELAEAEAAFHEKKKVVRKVPKGTSEYQAAWIIESDAEEDDDEDEDEEDSDEESMDDGADGMAAVEEEEEESDEGEEEDEDEMETVTLPDLTDDAKYDAELDLEEEERMRKKYQEERMDEMFPDEIDTPMDVPARLRFQKYRGLKSFRTSPWDPKENLPLDYARIFQFGNFKKTRKRLLADERDTGAMTGWYVTVHITAVPRAFMESYKPETPVVIYGLLAHEQKMSVVNVTLKRHPSFNGPIKNKERMIFHVGYRRYANNPLYSQHTTGDKHKFERFLRMDVVAVATMYAPIAFPPASVLMFKENADGTHQLVATGSVMSVNPDRIITKRMVISGHPYKINKRTSVIRYMFFNREDIYWFKPVELRTKYGRRGHIREPVGTHGHMKCVFDNQLKSQDTVLMNLYKRIFPKWTYDPHVPTPSNSTVVPVAMETADIPAMSLFD